jgi:hypothetical protein
MLPLRCLETMSSKTESIHLCKARLRFQYGRQNWYTLEKCFYEDINYYPDL